MEKRLEGWIRNALLDASRPCVQLRLEHVTDKEDIPLSSIRIDPEQDKEAQLQKAITEFDEAADANRIEFNRTQQYQIVVLGDGDRVLASRTFRLKPPTDMHSNGESEPPNAAGIIALELRAAESLLRSAQLERAAVSESHQRLLAAVFERNYQLETARAADFDALEKLRGQQHDRELEGLVVRSGIERKDRIIDKGLDALKPLIPEIFKRFNLLPGAASKPVKALTEGASKEAESTLSDSLKALARSFDDEQIEELSKILRAEQLTDLLAIVTGSDPVKIGVRLRKFIKSLDDVQETGTMKILRGEQAALLVACMPDEANEPESKTPKPPVAPSPPPPPKPVRTSKPEPRATRRTRKT